MEVRITEGKPMPPKYIVVVDKSLKKQHHFWGILFDFLMVLLTGGLWFIWIIIRYFRNH